MEPLFHTHSEVIHNFPYHKFPVAYLGLFSDTKEDT